MSRTPPAPAGRRELVVLGLLTLLALALRAWRPESFGIDHFDEGAYAFSGLGISDPSQPLTLFPKQVLFSPPVHIALVALTYLLASGPSGAATVWVAVLTGALTVPVLWGLVRRTAGPFAAAAAAALLACDGIHIGLSRTGLTDAPFLLLFLTALWAIVVAVERDSLPRAVLAGVVVALAWNTKYHGWFAAMIASAGALAFLLRGSPHPASWRRVAVLLASVCATAIVLYVPWALFVESALPGGYAELSRYQRTMLEPRGYLSNLVEQARNLTFLDQRTSLLALPLAVVAGVAATRDLARGVAALPALAVAALVAGLAGAPAARLLLAALTVAVALRNACGARERRPDLRTWTLLGCAGVFFFSTPIYHPYARLPLPLDAMLCALGAMALTLAPVTSGRPHTLRTAGLAAALLAGLSLALTRDVVSDPWRPAHGARDAAQRIVGWIPEGARTVVIGEPTLAFELHLLGRPAFERALDPARDLADAVEPVYLVVGRYARKAPKLRDGVAALSARRTELGRTPLAPPRDHRLLDDLRVNAVEAFLAAPDPSEYELTVYRIDPAESPPR